MRQRRDHEPITPGSTIKSCNYKAIVDRLGLCKSIEQQHAEIAKDFNVGRRTVYRIWRREQKIK